MKPISSIGIALLLLTATTALSVRVADSQELQAGGAKSVESVGQKSIASATPVDARVPATDPSLANIYRVGIGDVLDIRLLNARVPRSTLYIVVEGGLIDFPIAGGPISVAGLTADEIQSLIAEELKRRAVEESARVSVGVRQYASHTVNINGLVNNPGTKFLRREAVPLYVIMAEAQSRQDAGRVTIIRGGVPGSQRSVLRSRRTGHAQFPNQIRRPDHRREASGAVLLHWRASELSGTEKLSGRNYVGAGASRRRRPITQR